MRDRQCSPWSHKERSILAQRPSLEGTEAAVSVLYMKLESRMLHTVSVCLVDIFKVSPTADGETHSCTAGHRQKNCSGRVLKQKARKRKGGDVGSHLDDGALMAQRIPDAAGR